MNIRFNVLMTMVRRRVLTARSKEEEGKEKEELTRDSRQEIRSSSQEQSDPRTQQPNGSTPRIDKFEELTPV